MARKNESIINLLILLPWWVSVLTSLLVYIVGSTIIPSIAVENPFLQPIVRTLIPMMAPIVAIVLLIPAPISAFNTWRKRKLLNNQKSIQTIRELSWRQFEELVAEVYRHQGYTVIENTKSGADGGIDVKLRKNGHTYLVQCKNWRTSKVGVKVIREMYGVLMAEHASRVIIIVSGEFTQEAKNFASGKAIDLIDGLQLERLIVNIQSTVTKGEPLQKQPVTKDHKVCPKCGSALIFRIAKKGANAGNQFWGCTAYPKCRYIANS